MIEGGCDGSMLQMGATAILLVVTILVAYYVWKFAGDQSMLTAFTPAPIKRVTEGDLTRLMAGY